MKLAASIGSLCRVGVPAHLLCLSSPQPQPSREIVARRIRNRWAGTPTLQNEDRLSGASNLISLQILRRDLKPGKCRIMCGHFGRAARSF